MTQVIDRRLNGKKKSTVNRQRFVRRYKQQIKKAVADAVAHRSITDIEQGEKISIPARDILEPEFELSHGGVREQVFPGNKDFVAGDKFKRPEKGGQDGSGSSASNQGEGEDDFVFELSKEEFIELFFEDLELPDLVRKELAKVKNFKYIRAGIAATGTPANMNIIRTMRQATGRRIAMRAPYKRKLKTQIQALEDLLKTHDEDSPEAHALKKEIEFLKKRIAVFPFIDTIDLRFNNRVRVSTPSTQAVMFCIMDVSGSMDELKKEIAKKFFILLYLFLTRTYEAIELVFIRHHTAAQEVNEHDFFYSRETGGTVVSSALELMREVVQKRYPDNIWNIYAAQASDGDNWNADSPYCQSILAEDILPFVQYYAYVEIMPRHHQSLWEVYEKLLGNFQNFAMQNIEDVSHIYPVFRELFQRKIS